MSNIPWSKLLVGISGVAIIAEVISVVYQWAIQFDPGGPLSGVLSVIGAKGNVALAFLGGGLLVTVTWIFAQIGDSGF
ncbi:hypothetical protein Halar_0038 (plasmid) [halophilic archaeon DL31]|jgi:hypothetical protein|nr:hypothetical protein Halar_0038 [halophilic archaeon DL31]